MASLISENLTSAICEQIGNEKQNSNIYLFIAGFLKNKGLDRLAKLFEIQHQEEFEHSKKFFDILTDLNADVKIPEIDAVDIQFNSILDVAELYLQKEIETTESIEALKQMAMEEENSVCEEFFREMIRIQRAEYEEATSFQDKCLLTGGDWKFVMLWNQALGD